MTTEFGATSTTDDVLAGLDLQGKRVLVTGTSSGLGIETARALVAHGAYVVGTARDLDKAYAVTETVRAAAATSGGPSKTANALFAVEFDRRHKDRGIRAVAVHPGMINTGLTRNVDIEMLKGWMADINAARAQQGLLPFAPKTVPQGAATSVWAAFTAVSDEIGGRYCEDCHVAIEFNAPQNDGFSEGYRAYALDVARAAELWRKSEDLVGERY